MNQIFGEFYEDPAPERECLTLEFSPSSVPLKQRWRTSGLSADFMADYFASFFPGDESTPGLNTKAEVKSAVSFIANELLENAMKFADELSPYPIRIVLRLYSSHLVFLSTNSVNPQAVGKFQDFIHLLSRSDPSELYFEWLEKSSKDEEFNGSGLGILTMLHDYATKIGWKFETLQEEPKRIVVTTMVQLAV